MLAYCYRGVKLQKLLLAHCKAISNNVNQAGGSLAIIGIDVASDSDSNTAQSLARNVNQTGGRRVDNEDGTVQEWLLTEQDKTSSLNQLGLTLLQDDWTTGNSSQYPMLVDMDGGYQDMQRLSPEFREAMQDFAPPSITRTPAGFARPRPASLCTRFWQTSISMWCLTIKTARPCR